MRVVLDGIGFQPGGTAAAMPLPLWSALIDVLLDHADVDLVVFDRGGMHKATAGAIPFPPRQHADSPTDSILLQRMCDHLGAEVFVSTGFTTPLRTPSVLFRVGAIDPGDDDQEGERALALAYARVVHAPEGDAPPSPAELADALLRCARQAIALARDEDRALSERWESLRRLQAAVDAR